VPAILTDRFRYESTKTTIDFMTSQARYRVLVRHIDGTVQENWGAFDYENLPERIKDAIEECPEDGEWILSEDATGDRSRDLGACSFFCVRVAGNVICSSRAAGGPRTEWRSD